MTAPERIPVKKQPPGQFQWATKIKGRTPEFKIHRTEAHARSAVSSKSYFGTSSLDNAGRRSRASSNIAYYIQLDDEWVLKYSWRQGEILNLPWAKADPTEEELRAFHTREDWRVLQNSIMRFHDSLPGEKRRQTAHIVANFINGMNQVL